MAAPPGSTRLRIGEDVTWSDVGGVYERDDSLKENTNPKCLLKNVHHHGGSQRISGNLKPTAAPIIGLSGKLGGGRRNNHSHQHQQQHPPAMFPRKAKTGGGGREARQGVPEPGSPKVSCIGKVLSERERARRRSHHRQRTPPPETEMEETTSRGGGGGGGKGCCPGFGGFMGLRRSRSRKSAVESVVDWSPPPPVAEARRREAKPAVEEEFPAAAVAAPGLGGVMRFASGRRAADWAAAAGAEEDDRVAKSGPL